MLEKGEDLPIGCLPKGREVGVNGVDCSVDRVWYEGMSPYHVTNKSVGRVWKFENQN